MMKPSNSDREMLAEILYMIEQENKKNQKEQDYELIEQLTEAAFDAISTKDIASSQKEGFEKLLEAAEQQELTRKRKRWMRPLIAVCTCVALFFCLNIWTVRVWGKSPQEFFYEIVQGGITFRPSAFTDYPEIQLKVSDNDPYGIQTKCEEYGFSPRVPSYIPEKMKLKNVSEVGLDGYKHIGFDYYNEKKAFSIDYTYFTDPDLLDSTVSGFPIDDYNVYTETICGTFVAISWEDHVFRAKFTENQIVYDVFCKNLEYDTAYHILVSCFI